ncbi:hypothetical protein ABT56_18965 [Photobacterium aquae]|uniref:Uncharacterized protein n=1 Tax=Photobacterium aquae TaxID=1195763 RepID=A0A0J1GV68_9GAMM|nr:hypothetical protein [Photobacterium aquae]KLV03516.1 hypothetical protein ABT56_18965 [Photobacterium aquae]
MNFAARCDLLRTGTNDAAVAKNWHRSLVPLVRKDLNLRIIQRRSAVPDTEYYSLLDSEIADIESLLDRFFRQWPPAKVREIQDTISPRTIKIAEWQTGLSDDLPLKSLTLISQPTERFLFYLDTENGDVFKVINTAKNRPNMRQIVTWSY